MNAALKKALEKARASTKVRETEDKAFGAEYPVLHGFLTSTEGVGGEKHREPGSLFLFTADGLWKAVLGERSEGASLWASADSFEGLLLALEQALTSDNPDWRVKGPRGRYQAKGNGKK